MSSMSESTRKERTTSFFIAINRLVHLLVGPDVDGHQVMANLTKTMNTLCLTCNEYFVYIQEETTGLSQGKW
jgi:hypothetical protein